MEGPNGGFLSLFLVAVGVLMASMDSARAYKFYAGGRDGWVLHPSESYQDWSSRNRFQVNDTILFRYDKGQDSVLVVSDQQHFDACDTSNPIARLDGGDSLFRFDRSGSFFFISGVAANCQRGQKLLVVVMAVRRRQWAHPPISHPPSSLPPTPAPVSPASSPAGASPPVNPTPSPSPSLNPSAGPPRQGPSPGGGAISPAQAPSESDMSDGGGGGALNVLRSTAALGVVMILVAAILG